LACNEKPLSATIYQTVAKQVTGGTQKTLAGLDDIAHENGRLNFIAWIESLSLMLTPGSPALINAIRLVRKVEHFLEREYKQKHLKPFSRVAAHCTNHAFHLIAKKSPVSKFSSTECGAQCKGHDMFCHECDEIEVMRGFLEQTLLEFGLDAANSLEKTEDMTFLVKKCLHKLTVLIGHLVRVYHESMYFNEAVANLPLNTALMQADHKMKIEPMFYRESQVGFYGKKGITLFGVLFIFRTLEGELEYSSQMFFATSSDSTQDCFSTLGYLEQILIEFRELVPHIERVQFFSDGAGTFSGAIMRVCLPVLFAKYGYELCEANTGEAGNGKSIVDANFSRVTACITFYVIQKQGAGDVFSPETLVAALRASMGDKIVILHVAIHREIECDGFMTKIFLGLLSSVSSCVYCQFVRNSETGEITDFTTILRQHSGVGPGLSYSRAELDLGWTLEKQSFPVSSRVVPLNSDPLLSAHQAATNATSGRAFAVIPTEETKKVIQQELLLKHIDIQTRRQEKLKLASELRLSLAVKKDTINRCPEPRCTRMFIRSHRLAEHCATGLHSDGVNPFRTMQSGSVMNHEFSLNDVAKKHATLLLTGSGCAAVQRFPHHLSGSGEALQPEFFLLNDVVDTHHFVPDPGFGQQTSEPYARREFIVIRFLYLSFNYGNENKLFLVTADQTAADMPLFGTMLGQEKHPGHPLWIANADGVATFRVKHLLTTAIIKGYFSKNPSDFKKQYDRAMLKDAPAHPVIPQPLAFYELASSAGANSDLSDSDLDDSIDVEERTRIANSAATASEQMIGPGHAGGEDYQGGDIEASTENREWLVGASLGSLELAQARRAAAPAAGLGNGSHPKGMKRKLGQDTAVTAVILSAAQVAAMDNGRCGFLHFSTLTQGLVVCDFRADCCGRPNHWRWRLSMQPERAKK
jgi:hypothetical protein